MGETNGRFARRVRIPMKSAGDSERKRPPEPIEASRALW
jgi:hypothetical protein